MSNLFKSSSFLPHLNENEEIVLSKIVQNGILAYHELKRGDVDQKKKDFLTSEFAKAFEARNHSALANSHLVISIAKMFRNRGVGLEDLIQEGYIGLIKAAGRYDYREGFRFSTYAKRWVHEFISKSIANQSGINRLPAHIETQLISLLRVKQSLSKVSYRKPTIDELAEATRLPEEQVIKLLSLNIPLSSFDGICETNDSDLLENVVFQDLFPSPTITASLYFQKRFVDSILATLPEIQCLILKYRYGMKDGSFHTTAEISIILNLSLWQVRYHEDRGLRNLRKIVTPQEVSDYYLG